jgi:excisionase family DNA binding protein
MNFTTGGEEMLTGVRTIKEAVAEIQAADPNTAIKYWFVRELVVNGMIPSVRAGNKYLIRLADLEHYFNNELKETTIQ